MDQIPILRPAGEYLSEDKTIITGVNHEPIAEMSLAPPLLLQMIVNELKKAATQPYAQRVAAISKAGEIFAEGIVQGETPEAFCLKQAKATGVPISVVTRSLGEMKTYMNNISKVVESQRPQGASRLLEGLDLESGSSAFWMPRGKTLTVIAPSNHPMTHVSWIQALAFGLHVIIRPGSRDPFTPLRLIRSLLLAGLEPTQLAYVPCSYANAEKMINATDLSIIYGNEKTVASYRNHPHVLVRGPGRSKILVDVEEVTDEVIDVLAASVAADGGVRCTNVSAIFVHNHFHEVAEALAEKLAKIPVFPSNHPKSQLPSVPAAEAKKIRQSLEALMGDAQDLCCPYYPDGPVSYAEDGSAILRPSVILSNGHTSPGFGMELPFPCVWLSPWEENDGIEPLKDSLCVTLLTENKHLVRQSLEDHTIRKVFWGRIPTWYSTPYIPHDGYVSEFLLESKGFVKEGGGYFS
ncbi:acyl-CoA reductase [Brevibacillus ruminantium]|uniref:Acyl-CoA reductase n=1 Tax=Brevibacillus ruminantium TaxID=2950604 RepID=A0ABY4WCN3_9BACL|nr:aldehyde dehydrogenase family protein [Brevibacillus ruminantium]USG64606.1 acyl-CoA reductase [Brevibacillus ruminantium]